MTGKIAPEEVEQHVWWCDCAGCWTGITKCAPKPPTLFERFKALGRSYLETHKPEQEKG